MIPGDRGQVTGDSWKGDGKVRHGKEVVCSFHWACAIFPTVIFKLHGKGQVLWVQKYKFSQYFFLFLFVPVRIYLPEVSSSLR